MSIGKALRDRHFAIVEAVYFGSEVASYKEHWDPEYVAHYSPSAMQKLEIDRYQLE